MEKQQTEFKEEKKILQQKVEADEKAHQEQTTNMIKASIPKAEQDRTALMQENLDMIKHLEEMQQRSNHELKSRISLLQKYQEQVKNKIEEVSKEDYLLKAIEIVAGSFLAVALVAYMGQRR